MAENIWTNVGGDRDIGTAGNWTNAAMPANDDHVKFLSDYTAANSGPNAGMADAAANHPATVLIDEGYTQDIGASGNDLDFDYVTTVIRHHGSGKLWWKAGGGTTPWIVVNSTAQSPTTSVMNVTGATNTRLDVLRGGVTVDGSGTVTNLGVSYNTSPLADANVTLSSGATITNADQTGGTVTSSGTVATARVFNGYWTQDTAVIGTALWVFGGEVHLNFAGTYPLVYHFGGKLDVTGSGGRKTFTDYYYYPGAINNLIATPELLTITNEHCATRGGWT